MPALDEFENGDVPAALAPFETFNLDSIRPALKLFEDAAQDGSATLNLVNGTIVFSVQNGERHEVYPWMLLRDGPDRALMLAPFPPERRSAISESVLRVWGWMIADLAGEVACERWVVLAREDRPLAPISILPAGAWSVFTVEEWEHGTARCRYTGVILFDVHFRRLKTASQDRPVLIPTADDLGAEGVIASISGDGTIVEALQARVRDWPADLAQPGADKDQVLIEEKLGRKIDRAQFRRLRKTIVPGAADRGRRRIPKE